MSNDDVRLLIDGYNLLHAAGIFPAVGPATLERSRHALLTWLAARIESRIRPRTMVVFDGTDAPPGLDKQFVQTAMRVVFSRRKQSADDLLEELIAAAAFPRQLLVVSSDHRVQRAARQRGVDFVDSEVWVAGLPAPQDSASDDKPTSLPNPFPEGFLDDVQWDEM